MLKNLHVFIIILICLQSTIVSADKTDSFSRAKKLMMEKVYYDHRETLYCGAKFDSNKSITPPDGFYTDKHVKRAKRLEWEHVVPAENFGRTFREWREGHPDCINSQGKPFKGRNCTSKVNKEYRYMQSDLYNLYPAIGAVNALRSNFNFTLLPQEQSNFGSCFMKIHDRKAEPPESARGRIARTYLYMESAYPRYKMSKSQRNLMQSWDKKYPISDWECTRAERIAIIQGNLNSIIVNRCK